MANADRPNGLRLVMSESGPVTSQVRAIGVTDAADMFRGDALTLTSGLAAVAATNDATFLGVAIGFGKKDPLTGSIGPMNDVQNLEKGYYDDSASTHTDYVVFYVPTRGNVFEVQTNADLDTTVGANLDLVATAGDTATGQSAHEIGTNTNSDFIVVELPDIPGNDATLTNAVVWVKFNPAECAFDS